MSVGKKLDGGTDHFSDVAAQWDQKPSTISFTKAISEYIKKMDMVCVHEK